jgi:hypothetical protein
MFHSYDSKMVTGYVGLTNHGGTGYVNALLHARFCITAFRKVHRLDFFPSLSMY